MLKQDYYNDFFEFGQQKNNFSFYELGLPGDDPVYTLKKVMEDLNFSGLPACNRYGTKYDLGDAQMFVIEGMGKVRKVIGENRKRKLINYHSADKVYKEFMLYANGRNLMKYHRFLHHEIEKYEGKKEQKAA